MTWHAPVRARRGVVATATVVTLAAAGVVVSDVGGTAPRASAATITPSAAHDGSDPVIAAAGDIACDDATEAAAVDAHDDTQCQEQKTAALLQDPSIQAVLALGDDQYYSGDLSQFQTMYDRSWGSVLDKTYPVPGNHEYYGTNTQAQGYFAYFGARAGTPGQGWYSFDLGAWHLIALNTGYCTAIGGCGVNSPEEKWLRADLAAHPNQCTLAFWHQPYISGGEEGGTHGIGAFFGDLYNVGADVVLNGHNHDYERFAEQDPQGNAAPDRGLTEFVVGTGGRSQMGFVSTPANTVTRFDDSFGVLRMTLHPTSYDWTFVDAAGSTGQDSGTTACHVVKPVVTAPATVLRGRSVTVTGTGKAKTPVTLKVSNAKGAATYTVVPDATGSWSQVLPTTPDGGTYTIVASSGPQTSAAVRTTVTGTTIAGPASAARGGHAVLSGLAEPGRPVVVYVTRPGAKALAYKTVATASGRWSVTAPIAGDASWYAVSNSYRTPVGHTTAHGLTVSGPRKAVATKPVLLTGLAAPHAKVSIFTHSAHGRTAIGHVVRANAQGVYRLSVRLAVTSSWWAVSQRVRSPLHMTTITPAKKAPSKKAAATH